MHQSVTEISDWMEKKLVLLNVACNDAREKDERASSVSKGLTTLSFVTWMDFVAFDPYHVETKNVM